MLDLEMGVDVAWRTDLLAGYSHEFLPEADRIAHTGFREINNPSVAGALARANPDVVLLHGYTNLTTLRALAWCRLNGVPTLMISDSSLHSGTAPAVRAAKAALLPLVFAQFSAFLAIGDANEAYLKTYGVAKEKLFRVPNMVDEGFWSFRDKRSATRAEKRAALGLGDDVAAFLFVGKFISRKRPADLIAALARLRSRALLRKPVALFAGAGEQRDMLISAAAEAGVDARFLGFVNLDELPALYCAADALVHPAEIETFGVIVLEAAILGLPLILSDRVGALGPSSIARANENALVYPCGDVSALAEAIAQIASDRAIAGLLGARSLAISRDLDWSMSVGGTLAAVRSCLNRQLGPVSS